MFETGHYSLGRFVQFWNQLKLGYILAARHTNYSKCGKWEELDSVEVYVGGVRQQGRVSGRS